MICCGRTAFIAAMISAFWATAHGHAQTTGIEFPDARMRVEVRYDDPARKLLPRSVRVRDSQCRETIADLRTQNNLRQRIVDLAAREWEAFHFPVLDIASKNLPFLPNIHTRNSGPRGRPILPSKIGGFLIESQTSRMLRNGLMEDDPSITARIGGYWAIVPGASAIATQNVIWGKSGWPGAGWAQPWSAAFISWVMCEAGLTRAQFNRAASHAAYLTPFFRSADASAYVAKPLTEKPEIGDLLCTGRDQDNPISSLHDAEEAAHHDAPMHCDIIVGLMPDRILLIGGNVQNGVAMTITPRAANGPPISNAHRPWFGIMKLQAPADAKAGLARTPWRCLGQRDAMTCLKND